MTFVNFSNHPSKGKVNPWRDEQLKASEIFGKIIDITFPEVPADAEEGEVEKMAKDYSDQIIALNPDCVMCQGEFTLTYKVITMLKHKGIRVVAACSERNTVIVDGKKVSEFVFVRYREY